MKVLYRDYKNIIEDCHLVYSKGEYNKETKEIEITFDSIYDNLFNELTEERIMKVCDFLKDLRVDNAGMFINRLKVFSMNINKLNDEQKETALKIINENIDEGNAVAGVSKTLEACGFEKEEAKAIWKRDLHKVIDATHEEVMKEMGF